MKTTKSRVNYWFVLSILISAISFSSNATILVSESFDYPDGAIAGQTGGTGWASGWTGDGDVVSGVAVPTFNGIPNFRLLENAIQHTDGTKLYLSFDIDGSQNVFQAFAGLSFFTGGYEPVFFGNTFFETSLGLEINSPRTPTNSGGSEGKATMVAEILFGSVQTTFNVFINPMNFLSDETFSVTVDTSRLGGSWDSIRLASGGPNDLNVSFDNIIIATSKRNVLVPEPAMYGLFIIACVALFRQKRYL